MSVAQTLLSEKLNLQIDDLTVLLVLIAATLFLLSNLYKPQALIHPIVLGRQSDVGRARNSGESAVYRNYGTGLVGRLAGRPSKEILVVKDLVRAEIDGSRTLWSTRLTNNALQDRVASFGTGLVHSARLEPEKSKVLLLLNDSLEFLIADLALASHSIVSVTLSSSTLLSQVIKAQSPSVIICHGFFVPRLLEELYNEGRRHLEHTIIVVGETSKGAMASIASNLKVLRFEEVEREGMKREKVLSLVPSSDDVFSISYFETGSGEVEEVHLSHENITAAVSGIRGMFPSFQTISALDTVLSTHSMSTAYGRGIAYSAVFEGTSFGSIAGGEVYYVEENRGPGFNLKRNRTAPATIVFLNADQLGWVTDRIEEEAKKSWLYKIGWRHKVVGVRDGFVSNQTLWDRLVFDGAREKVMGSDIGVLRGVVVGGGKLEANVLSRARILLSIPIINTLMHGISAGPILATHAFDVQEFGFVSCGAPCVNVEVKLIGVDDELVESGGDAEGELLVKGPPVGGRIWGRTGVTGRVMSNGSFVVYY